MTSWFWIVAMLLVIAAGASWNAMRLAGRGRRREHKSLRARRAALWRRRREAEEQLAGERKRDGAL